MMLQQGTVVQMLFKLKFESDVLVCFVSERYQETNQDSDTQDRHSLQPTMQNKAMNCAYLALIKNRMNCSNEWLIQQTTVDEMENELNSVTSKNLN